MAVLLFDLEDGEHVGIGAEAATRLAALGVTSIALALDDGRVAVVLEGWAFDARGSAAEAASIVNAAGVARILHPVLEMSVS